jgi:hypothetical protein
VRPVGLNLFTDEAKELVTKWPSRKGEIEEELSKKRAELDDEQKKYEGRRQEGAEANWMRWSLDRVGSAVKRLDSDLAEGISRANAATRFIECPCMDETKTTRKAFKQHGWDVVFQANWGTKFPKTSAAFYVEIKPLLGDDFPANCFLNVIRTSAQAHDVTNEMPAVVIAPDERANSPVAVIMTCSQIPGANP